MQPARVHQLHPAVTEVGDHGDEARAVCGTAADERDRRSGGAGRGRRILPAGVERGDGSVSIGERPVEQVLDGLEVAAGGQLGPHPAVDRLGGCRRRRSAVAVAAGAVEDAVQRGGRVDEQPVLVTMRPPAHTDVQIVGGGLDHAERQLH